MKYIDYNRKAVVEYAEKWAFARNPKYYNFDSVGGDCTSFVSQCIYAGSQQMNYTKDLGWYYINGNNKSPSWSGVEYLHKFLVNNKSIGPQAEEVSQNKIELGDIAQLSFDGIKFAHSLVIVNIENKYTFKGIKVATHTFDSFNKSISEYQFKKIRFMHVKTIGKH